MDKDMDDNSSIATSKRSVVDESGAPRETSIVGAEELKRVTIFKGAMITVLLAVAGIMAGLVYREVKQQEAEEFERDFQNYASEIVAVSTEHVHSSFGTIEAFGNMITSYATNTNQSWPMVTIPDYTSKAIRVAELAANSRLVTFAPLVQGSERLAFEEYARGVIHYQIQEDIDYLQLNGTATELQGIPDRISYFNLSARQKFEEVTEGPYMVNWQRYPFETAQNRIFVMNNMLRIPTIRNAVVSANLTKSATASFLEALMGIESQVIQPVFQDVLPPHRAAERKMVGVVWVVLSWANYFQNLLPSGVDGIFIVLRSSCGFETTFLVNGLEATTLGLGDFHDADFDDYVFEADFFAFDAQGVEIPEGTCIDELTLSLYPSRAFKDDYETSNPWIYMVVVIGIFVFTIAVFLLFDWAVRRYRKRILGRVERQDRIVANLFPDTIRARLYEEGNSTEEDDTESQTTYSSKMNLFEKDLNHPEVFRSKAIADLHLESTILFADVVGFTAWSSTRDPSQVLKLLETLFGAWDKLAHKHKIFKVETVGDCYVAVAGVPKSDPNHAVNMAKFARAITSRMPILTRKLEVVLGPGTADLRLRVGIHSGQVTAGVLRGERSRYQLFGDSVNTTARMESTSLPGRIQISASTAEALCAKGRSKWIVAREEQVFIKGKEEVSTFWLLTKAELLLRNPPEEIPRHSTVKFSTDEEHQSIRQDGSTNSDAESDEDKDDFAIPFLSKRDRLVEWHVETLSGLIRQIVASRVNSQRDSVRQLVATEATLQQSDNFLNECKDIVALPRVKPTELMYRADPDKVVLGENVVGQLRKLIVTYSFMYQENPFHNFEHASHVTSSVQKMLTRIVDVRNVHESEEPDQYLVDLAGHSYGIAGDPLTQFAVVFSALIHDAEHPGVTNAQLQAEGASLVKKYAQSTAEQNSLFLAWEVFMDSDFKDLRACIYSNAEELKRFRQLVVNTVMATDICDKELGALRKARWQLAFAAPPEAPVTTSNAIAADGNTQPEDVNRKATIVIEHLIQASDVSHTMQHWSIYRLWNEKFFQETYSAFLSGRSTQGDPSLGWYQGELGFFQFYIIPLAKKLESCGVFGVSSQEYLQYAISNRNEWERRGEAIVQEYLSAYREKYGDRPIPKESMAS